MTACKKKTAADRMKDAEQLLQEKQVPLAMITLKDIIEQYPDDPATNDARFTLAQVYVGQGRKEYIPNAIELLKAVHKSLGFADERGLEAYRGIVELTAQNDDLPGAIKLAQEAADQLKDKPVEAFMMQSLASQLELSASDEGTQKLGIDGMEKTMLEHEDASARGQARESLAQFYRIKEDFAGSNAVYEKYLAKYPDDPVNSQLYMAQAINYKALKDDTKSNEAFARGEELMTKDIDGELNLNQRADKLMTLATFYGAVGRVDDAEKQFRRIMAEQPATRMALNAQFDIAKLYIQNKKYEEADTLLAQIGKENANTPIEQSANAWRLQLGQQRKAEAEAADGATSDSMTQQTPAAAIAP
ncbi:MAG: tetratricopeptide repeat protein [Candidatus Sumerlaeota bacterium]